MVKTRQMRDGIVTKRWLKKLLGPGFVLTTLLEWCSHLGPGLCFNLPFYPSCGNIALIAGYLIYFFRKEEEKRNQQHNQKQK